MDNAFRKWIAICGGSRGLAWLTVINVAVWLVVTLLHILPSPFSFPLSPDTWLSLPSSFVAFIHRPWTLLTYMVVQYDFLHLLFNVLWLYWFGVILLISLSDRQLLWLYVGGGLCGGVSFMISSTLGWGGGWLCGSSASVLAVMAAAAIRMPDHRLNLFLIGPVALKWVAIVCGAITLIGGGGNQAAHLGGLLWGIAYTLPTGKLRGLRFTPRTPNQSKPLLHRRADKVVDALERHRRDTQRLDELLDKIRVSGYGSLSRRERTELQDLSSRLKK